MYTKFIIKPPFFEIGPKAYLYGKKALELAQAADRISQKYEVPIIFTPQYVDIPIIAGNTEHLLVFAQHMDAIRIGIGIGTVLPESLKEAGAVGVMLNHAERRLALSELNRSIKRADEVGLATLVCADTPEEAAAIAQLGPNIILAEPPELIGTGISVANTSFIPESIRMIKSINPKILVINSAGIRSGSDVAQVIRAGAEATGSTSGIIKAENPIAMVEEMIKSLKEAWKELHPG
jgi:triosephosphate isomerase (TIM)